MPLARKSIPHPLQFSFLLHGDPKSSLPSLCPPTKAPPIPPRSTQRPKTNPATTAFSHTIPHIVVTPPSPLSARSHSKQLGFVGGIHQDRQLGNSRSAKIQVPRVPPSRIPTLSSTSSHRRAPPVISTRTIRLTRTPSHSNFGVAGNKKLPNVLPRGVEYPRHIIRKHQERITWVKQECHRQASDVVRGVRERCISLPSQSPTLGADRSTKESSRRVAKCPHDGCDKYFSIIDGGDDLDQVRAHLKIHLVFAQKFVCFVCQRAYETRKELSLHKCRSKEDTFLKYILKPQSFKRIPVPASIYKQL